jgi:hypothetical protein
MLNSFQIEAAYLDNVEDSLPAWRAGQHGHLKNYSEGLIDQNRLRRKVLLDWDPHTIQRMP